MYRLLAIDIDGTLVNSRNELTPATRAALARAGEAGIHVVLATGRRYSHALPLVEPLGIDVPLVTASGALVKDPVDHRTLYQAAFRAASCCWTRSRIVDRCGFDPVVCADTFAEGFDYYHARPDVRTPELAYYLDMNPGRGRLWPELLTNPPPGIFSGFATGTHEQMLDVGGGAASRAARQTAHARASPAEVCRILHRDRAGRRDEVVGHPAAGSRLGNRRQTKSAPWATT